MQTGTIEASFTIKIQEIEGRISGIDNMRQEIYTSFKMLNLKDTWHKTSTKSGTLQRPNVRIIWRMRGKEYLFKGPENIFNKSIENFPRLKMEIPIKIQEA